MSKIKNLTNWVNGLSQLLYQCPDMGKNALDFPKIIHSFPLIRPFIYLILLNFMMAVAAEDIRMKILKEINKKRIPHVSQVFNLNY